MKGLIVCGGNSSDGCDHGSRDTSKDPSIFRTTDRLLVGKLQEHRLAQHDTSLQALKALHLKHCLFAPHSCRFEGQATHVQGPDPAAGLLCI
jgi:hypothetical protein